MPASDHAANALASAKAARLESWKIEAMDYRAIAGLANVRIEANGDSPADFFWRNVQRHVAKALLEAETAAKVEAERKAIETQIRKSLSLANVTVSVDERGEIVVRRRR